MRAALAAAVGGGKPLPYITLYGQAPPMGARKGLPYIADAVPQASHPDGPLVEDL